MTSLHQDLETRLTAIRDQGLLRNLRRIDSPQSVRIQIDGRHLLNFSSNDYLGLANHLALREAAINAIDEFGAGAGASRLICGSMAPFHDLEQAIAKFKGTEAALTFSTGYAAAIGTITSLLDKDDIVIIDKLVHACIVDAARLSGARLRVFRHNNLDDLERILKWAAGQRAAGILPADQQQRQRILIITESVFSMDGDVAPLKQLADLKDRFGAWLMVDEAHATGLYGENGRGLVEALGLSDRVEIQMGTLGKALGASGGYICGSRELIDILINRARSFIFSTAPVPAAAGAALAAVRIVTSKEGAQLRAKLWENVSQLREALKLPKPDCSSAILPLIVGDENRAVQLADVLRDRGFLVPAIRYPTVARGAARLRITLTAAHHADEISQLASALMPLDIGLMTLD
jgi:8-amino-7-oxononanoate synthase